MKLSDLHPAFGEKKKKKRVARGIGSGHGVRATRGQKGQRSRTGKGRPPGFEGGQNPLYRRLPKINNFKNIFRKFYQWVNVADLNDFKDGTEVTKEVLAKEGYIDRSDRLLKVLGDGEIKKSLTVFADKFSKSAKEKIEHSGGKAVLINKNA